MHQWMILSGLTDGEISSGRFEGNMQVVGLDESNVIENSQIVQLVFLKNAEHLQGFMACIRK